MQGVMYVSDEAIVSVLTEPGYLPEIRSRLVAVTPAAINLATESLRTRLKALVRAGKVRTWTTKRKVGHLAGSVPRHLQTVRMWEQA